MGTTIFYLLLIALIGRTGSIFHEDDHLKQLSRSLMFPATSPTRVQFIGGIGIPVEDLHFESVTSGYVLKTEYFLPTTAQEITRVYMKPQPITGRHDESNFGSTYRWIIYRSIEMVLRNMNLPGRPCLLRVICEHAAHPLTHESGLLGELLHIVLTPSSSSDSYSLHTDREYLTAERFGKRGGNCVSAYGQKCSKSPIDLVTMLM
ncbi:uncharacterized protein LOC132786506 [Drosophila nasuta]|uniref:Uncharacterized protein LOC117575019 n=1 Tax=Drosophila albomicans TaxID=7291 RepID=A0A6P8XPK4_DROAB|nr:uncharacterized protein LOC117575019 [Drosophila albomicans]XP_060649031.1 uncharacterized protein LOC132786506 [Drosophila nasuta]